jgi:hypothetical protein
MATLLLCLAAVAAVIVSGFITAKKLDELY